MIETVNIEGKLFVEDEEIVRFWKRARNGEFSKRPCGASAHKKKKTSILTLLASRSLPLLNYCEASVAKWQTHKT